MSRLLEGVIGEGSPHVLLLPRIVTGVVSDVFECVADRGHKSESADVLLKGCGRASTSSALQLRTNVFEFTVSLVFTLQNVFIPSFESQKYYLSVQPFVCSVVGAFVGALMQFVGPKAGGVEFPT